jgi:NADPH:quinone reductase
MPSSISQKANTRKASFMRAIVMEKLGGPEVLQLQTRPTPEPGRGQLLVNVITAGVNYMDVGTRTGVNTAAGPLPAVPGVEGVGTVAALGPEVTGIHVGDRVAWFFAPGSYAEQLLLPAASAVPVPESIRNEIAASLMMQGLAANHMTTESYAIQPGDVAFVHSAAGGLGLMLTQLIKARGGRVIGRVSSPEKAEIARAAGADDVVVTNGGDFVDEVSRMTGGQGVAVVYDGAGADTFASSLAVLGYHGTLAYYGQTIKPLPPIDLLTLPKSVLVTYPRVHDHVRTREALLTRSAELFHLVEEGKLHVSIGGRYPLAAAARAHEAIQSRTTAGKLLLLP